MQPTSRVLLHDEQARTGGAAAERLGGAPGGAFAAVDLKSGLRFAAASQRPSVPIDGLASLSNNPT